MFSHSEEEDMEGETLPSPSLGMHSSDDEAGAVEADGEVITASSSASVSDVHESDDEYELFLSGDNSGMYSSDEEDAQDLLELHGAAGA